jgi:ABC-2 type transport system permease protein
MKAFDIASKDLTRSYRSASALVFMFGLPLLVTGMFYLMFGNLARSGEFSLPRTNVIVANMDAGGPKFQVNPKNIPGGKMAKTMGDLIVSILQSDDFVDLIQVSLAPDPDAARAAVDNQTAQVAIIIPADFSEQFADPNGQAEVQFYQDPTLTVGPAIMHAILDRFMEGMSGVKIAVKVFLDEAAPEDDRLAPQVVDQYLEVSLAQRDNVEGELLDVHAPVSAPEGKEAATHNLLLSMISPIMAGMMVFYAFYTGTSTAQSILREEEEHTLPRLFTTPTPQATILTGKLLSVFMTVSVQVIVLIFAAHFIFGIQWGKFLPMALAATGLVVVASSFGIFVVSFMRSTKESGAVFGAVLTVTGMLGMIPVFAVGSASAARMGETVSLLVPQGWAIRGLLQAIDGREPLSAVLLTALVLLVGAVAFFAIGVLRFNRRYA